MFKNMLKYIENPKFMLKFSVFVFWMNIVGALIHLGLGSYVLFGFCSLFALFVALVIIKNYDH